MPDVREEDKETASNRTETLGGLDQSNGHSPRSADDKIPAKTIRDAVYAEDHAESVKLLHRLAQRNRYRWNSDAAKVAF